MADYNLVAIKDVDSLRGIYPLLEQTVNECNKVAYVPLFAPDLYRQAISGDIQILTATLDNEIRGLCVVSKCEGVTEVCAAYMIPGTDSGLLPWCMQQIMEWARSSGHKGVEFTSIRRGFARRMSKLGFRPAAVIYRAEL